MTPLGHTTSPQKSAKRTFPGIGILVGCAGEFNEFEKRKIRTALKDLQFKFEGKNQEIENPGLFVMAHIPGGSAFEESENSVWARLGRSDASYSLLFQDKKTRKLSLQVDPLGTRQWYYVIKEKQLFFATDIYVLRKVTGISRISLDAVLQYLFLNYPLLPGTYYEGIFQLELGKILTWDIENGLLLIPQLPLDTPTSTDYFEILKEAVNEVSIYPGKTAFHLSGGIDSSLLLHFGSESQGSLTAFTAFYSPSHADLQYSRLVAAETNATLHEVEISRAQFLNSVEELRTLSDGPVMAIGLPTFDVMAREAGKLGISQMISGIGGDHLFTGYKKRKIVEEYGFLMGVTNVDLAEVRWVFESEVFELLIPILEQQVLKTLHSDVSVVDRVELFYREHFVKEHSRMANLAHMKYGIDLFSPFWNQELMVLGKEIMKSRTDFEDKGFLREVLKAKGSKAADRYDKEQMAIHLRYWQDIAREELIPIFNRGRPVIEGIRTESVLKLLAPDHPYNKSEFRLLWILFNLYRWLDGLNIDRISLYQLSTNST